MAENKTNMTILGHLMGHTSTRTTQRYIANNSEYHRQMVEELAERFGDIPNIRNGDSSQKVASKVASNSKSENQVVPDGNVSSVLKAS